MSFVEKFRRTPNLVVWLVTAAIGGAAGYLASNAIGPAFFLVEPTNLYQRVLWRIFGDWDQVIKVALSFAAIPIMMMLMIALVLPWHHRPNRTELTLAAAIPTLWPAWITATEAPKSLLQAVSVAWGVYLIVVAGAWFLCARIMRIEHAPRLLLKARS